MVHGYSFHHFRYAIEKITNLGILQANPLNWGELLCKENLYDFTEGQWDQWYKDVVSLVPQILSKTKFNLISINLDSDHILNPNIVTQVNKLKGLPVGIEWTEKMNTLTDDQWSIIAETLNDFKKNGFHIILDDVGKGECLLHRATTYIPDIVKIDGPIFKKSINDLNTFLFLNSIIKMFKDMHVVVTIEWVESLKDYLHAKKLGAEYGQGFYWNTKAKDFNLLQKDRFGGFMEAEVVSQEEFDEAVENGQAFTLSIREAKKYGFPIPKEYENQKEEMDA